MHRCAWGSSEEDVLAGRLVFDLFLRRRCHCRYRSLSLSEECCRCPTMKNLIRPLATGPPVQIYDPHSHCSPIYQTHSRILLRHLWASNARSANSSFPTCSALSRAKSTPSSLVFSAKTREDEARHDRQRDA